MLPSEMTNQTHFCEPFSYSYGACSVRRCIFIMRLSIAEKARRARQKAEADPNTVTTWAKYRTKEFEKRKRAEQNSPDCAPELRDRAKDELVDQTVIE